MVRLNVENDPLYPDTVFLSDLGVEVEERGQGLGRNIMRKAIEVAGICGAKEIRMACEKDTWQLEWYKRLGFVETGVDEYDKIMLKLTLTH